MLLKFLVVFVTIEILELKFTQAKFFFCNTHTSNETKYHEVSSIFFTQIILNAGQAKLGLQGASADAVSTTLYLRCKICALMGISKKQHTSYGLK